MGFKDMHVARLAVSAGLVAALGGVAIAPAVAVADNVTVEQGTDQANHFSDSGVAEGVQTEKLTSITTLTDRYFSKLTGSQSSADKHAIYNVLFANGEDVIVEPNGDDGLKITVGGQAYGYDFNTDIPADENGGLTIFAGSNGATDSGEISDASGSVTIMPGAKVAAVYGGGYANSAAANASVTVEKGASVRAVYGGGLTPYANSGVTSGCLVENVNIEVKGYAYLVYAGGNSAVGVGIDKAITLNEDWTVASATNRVKSATVNISGTCDNYFGGSFSYGAVDSAACTVSGVLGEDAVNYPYSGVAGANGYLGKGLIKVAATGMIKSPVFMSMRGYVGDVALENEGTIKRVSLNPDGADVSSFGTVMVQNGDGGTIESCNLDCGCTKKSLTEKLTAHPKTIIVSGDVEVSALHWEDEYFGSAPQTTQYTPFAGQTIVLKDGARLANGLELSNVAVAKVNDNYYTSLKSAIEAANSGDVISLCSRVTLTSAIAIDKPVSIAGNNNVITSTAAGGRFFTLSDDAASLSIDGAAIAVPFNAVPVTTPANTVPITIKNCTIRPKDDTGCIVNFAQGGPVKFEFTGNAVDVSARGLLVNVSNGSKITDNTIDLKGEQTLAKDNRTGAISLVATAGGEGVEISGNTFRNANRCLGVDHSTLEASKITFKNNKFIDVRFALEFDPASDGGNAATGTYDVNYSYYSFAGEVSAPKIEDASSKGNHLDGTTEYKPAEGASRVDNSIYYLRDTMLESDLNTYVPPVTPPTPSDKTEVEHNQDGSTTTTVTKPDGSQTITHETATGTSSTVTKDEGGNVTSTEVSVSKADAESGKVELPIEKSEPAAEADKAPAVEVKVPSTVTADKPVQVTVPVSKEEGAEPDQGVVVYAVDAEGNETVLPKCSVDEDGNVVFEATGDVTIKVVDAAKDMPDVKDSDWFAGDVVDFATARGIVNGVDTPSGRQFKGYDETSRGMLVAMLHNLELNPEAASEDSLADVPSGAFYADAAAWALEEGILSGVDMPDGTKQFQGESAVTREQVAVFLMRYAEHLGMDVSKRVEIGFPDAGEVSSYAEDAMSWAVANGLFKGDDATGELNPTDGAARAEVAAVLMRFINLMYA